MSCPVEDARRRKLARPLYLELRALGLDVCAVGDGGEWRVEAEGLRSLSPTHADRARAGIEKHERGLLWILFGGWDPDLEAIQREGAA